MINYSVNVSACLILIIYFQTVPEQNWASGVDRKAVCECVGGSLQSICKLRLFFFAKSHTMCLYDKCVIHRTG